EGADTVHVLLEVAGELEDGAEPAELALEVEEGEREGDTCIIADVVESALPIFGVVEATFRRDEQPEVILPLEGLHGLLDDAAAFGAVDGDAAERAQPGAPGALEHALAAKPA